MNQKLLLYDYLFWILIVFYLDPGGLIYYFLNDRILGIPPETFIGLSIYLLLFISKGMEIFNNRFIRNYLTFSIIWLFYYWIIHGWWISDYYNSPIKMIINGQRIFWSFAILIPIVFYSQRSVKPFVIILSIVNVIILMMFVSSAVFSFKLLPIMVGGEGTRGFTDLARFQMYGLGLIYFGIPLAVSMIYYKGIKNIGVLILLSAILVFFHHVLLILRRELLGILIYIFINTLIFNYLKHKNLLQGIVKLINVRSLFILFLFFISLWLVIPTHVESTFLAVYDAIHVIIFGDNLLGIQETRIGLTGTKDIIQAIQSNPFFGTGFHPDWYSGHRSVNEFKGSDYVFLSAIGMYGIVGLVLFIKFYIFAIRYINRLLKLIRYYFYPYQNFRLQFSYAVVISIASSSEIIRNIIEYPNWFLPIGASNASPTLFIYLGLLIGCYNYLYIKAKEINNLSLAISSD